MASGSCLAWLRYLALHWFHWSEDMTQHFSCSFLKYTFFLMQLGVLQTIVQTPLAQHWQMPILGSANSRYITAGRYINRWVGPWLIVVMLSIFRPSDIHSFRALVKRRHELMLRQCKKIIFSSSMKYQGWMNRLCSLHLPLTYISNAPLMLLY